MPLPVWRWRRPRCSLMGPSFFSSGGDGTCQRSAPSCGTSSQSGKSIPSLLLVLAFAEETSARKEWETALLTSLKSTLFLIDLFLTSVTVFLSDIFLRGLMSLFLRWTWYIFSAAPQDLGLSSGGMVTPYSQPSAKIHTHTPHRHTHRPSQTHSISKMATQWRDDFDNIFQPQRSCYLSRLQPCCCQSSSHPPRSIQMDTQTLLGFEPFLHSTQHKHCHSCMWCIAVCFSIKYCI